jgi:hypothetical protein
MKGSHTHTHILGGDANVYPMQPNMRIWICETGREGRKEGKYKLLCGQILINHLLSLHVVYSCAEHDSILHLTCVRELVEQQGRLILEFLNEWGSIYLVVDSFSSKTKWKASMLSKINSETFSIFSLSLLKMNESAKVKKLQPSRQNLTQCFWRRKSIEKLYTIFLFYVACHNFLVYCVEDPFLLSSSSSSSSWHTCNIAKKSQTFFNDC